MISLIKKHSRGYGPATMMANGVDIQPMPEVTEACREPGRFKIALGTDQFGVNYGMTLTRSDAIKLQRILNAVIANK